MDNSNLFKEANEEMKIFDIKLYDRFINEDERDAEISKIKEKYKIGPGMENELEWLKWRMVNIPMHPAQKHVYEKRIQKLTNA